jgi:hypothetical protein
MAKKDKKVRCALCASQYKKFCTTKRVGVSLNKSRHCDKFKHDQTKVTIERVLPTTRLPYTEQAKLKEQQKNNLKMLREHLKKEREEQLNQKAGLSPKTHPIESRIYKPHGNEKYPLTGDLSRFTTTGTGEDGYDGKTEQE